MCLSEQYVKCALPACLVLVLVGCTDPSRPFQVNDETILCRKALDAATGSAAPALRYFCSQAHCEEDKRDHEVTMKEYISELARKEGELKRIEEELNADYGHFNNQMADWKQKQAELEEDLKRERESHELKLRELKSEVHKTKRPLKEMGEVMKRETTNLEQLFKKKTLEIQREMIGLSLLQSREMHRLNSRSSSLHEEKEVFYRAKYAADETTLQQQLRRLREDNEQVNKQLLKTRENFPKLKEQQLAVNKELDAINAQLSSNDKGSATAATSAADPGPVKTPAEQPEHLKATSSKKGTKEERSGKVNPATELARKVRELERKTDEYAADLKIFMKRGVEWRQKRDESEEDLKRERQNHELKLRELKADLYTSKRPLKEMGEVMKRETANLQRIFRRKELESEREVAGISLLQSRDQESMCQRQIHHHEELEVFYRETYAGDKTVLHQQLLKLRESNEISHNSLLHTRESIRFNEEQQLSLSKELDAINAEIGSNDKDTAAATTSAAYSGPVKTPSPSEHAPADTLRSTSVTDNPLLPNGSSSASPSSEVEKVISPLEEKMNEDNDEEKRKKEADERMATFEERVREKQADLKKKKDVIEKLEVLEDGVAAKLRDMGALTAGGTAIRTDLTEEEKLVAAPIDATYQKYRKLKRSLTRDHDMKKCELDIEIAKFNTNISEEKLTVLIRKIDNEIENVLTEGGCDAERVEEKVRVLRDDLVKVLQEIVEFNSQRALLEKRLQELVAKAEGDALVPAAKPPPHAPSPPSVKDNVGDTQLFNASANGNLTEVKKLLTQGADVNKADNDGVSPLWIASQNGHSAVVECLLQRGADKDKTRLDGASPLYIAALDGHLGVVQLLLEQGADKDKADSEGWTALINAAQNGHLAVVQKLLEYGADKNRAKNDGVSPLWIAAVNGHSAVVQYLLQHGANKDKTSIDGNNPLHAAAANGHLGVVQLLIEQGADKDKASNEGWTALINAALNGHLAVIQKLLEYGADKEKSTVNGVSPLFIAAQNGHLTVVQYLLEHGVDKDKAKNNGVTPLFIAAQNGHLTVVRYLLEQGADKEKASNNGASPLYVAAHNGHLAVVQDLVERGADKDKALNSGASPLFIAAENGHLGVLQYLLEQGADKDNANNNGVSPLWIAAQNGHPAVVQFLLQQGADVNKASRGRKQPIDVAANEEIKQLIRDEIKRRKKHKPN